MNHHLFGLMFFVVFILIGAEGTVLAETQYISDRLVVVLRDVPQDQFNSLDSLTSDTPVTVLGEEKRFYHVRTNKGLEGYILKQYLTAETPKALVVEKLQVEAKRLKTQIAQLQERLAQEKGGLAEQLQSESERVTQLQSSLQETQQALATSNESLQNLQQKHQALSEDAKDVVAIVQERDGLNAKVAELQAEVTTLEQENTTLLRSGVIKWFLAGGGVFFFGWIVGKISRKKRRGL